MPAHAAVKQDPTEGVRRGLTQRLLAAASLALVAATMLSAQAAQADVRTFRFGVVAGAPTPEADLDRMREARVKSVRVYLHWASIE